ncbi:MAG: alpha/beta hydrolase [Spirochaetota bacterium]
MSDVRLDIYSPPEGDSHPVFIFVHGRGWDSCDKEAFVPVAMRLIPRDMVVVIPDCTLHPDATYEETTAEIAAAVSWTFANAARYRGDPNRVVLGRHSAGGHLSALVAFDTCRLNLPGTAAEPRLASAPRSDYLSLTTDGKAVRPA